jgi:signal transduction histidine kinase
MNQLRVLLVEDSPTDARLLLLELQHLGLDLQVERVETFAAMSAALDRQTWDVILADWALPTFGATAALALVKERQLDVPFIIVSGTIGEESAVDAMRAGAHDYVLKDRLARLGPAIEREIRESRMRAERKVAESDRQRLEAQLRQAQKMEAIGRLAGGVAHDMNNMLAVVLSYLELLEDSLSSGDPRCADIADIRTATDRGVALTRQLLAFSRQQVLNPVVVDLGKILGNVVKMVTTLIGADVRVDLVLATEPLWVEVDPGQIEQVVMNLAVNARDAMPRGGSLHFATERVDERVRLRVSDTGTGMDAATKERIFEPFFTTKEAAKGTGLGLATVFGIVKQSHGDIAVHSELGQGTTFTIELPLVAAPREAARASREPAVRGTGDETILLLEDNAPLRAVLARTLRARGYRVLEAGTGDEALEVLEDPRQTVHLLLTDIVLPGVSGAEVARRVRDRSPRLKIMFMSGYADPSEHADVPLGTARFLQKPFEPETLAARVRETLDEA